MKKVREEVYLGGEYHALRLDDDSVVVTRYCYVPDSYVDTYVGTWNSLAQAKEVVKKLTS